MLVLLFLGWIGGGVAGVAGVRCLLPPDPLPSEDHFWAIGRRGGQGPLRPLPALTLIDAGLVFIFAQSDPLRLVLSVSMPVIAFAPFYVQLSGWPPTMPAYIPPSPPASTRTRTRRRRARELPSRLTRGSFATASGTRTGRLGLYDLRPREAGDI